MTEEIKKSTKEFGTQPLETIMTELGLKNSDLVESSSEQLTHKMVAKARKGRELGKRLRMKVLNAMNSCQHQKVYTLLDLFNY